jgi:hypothetical protein
MTDLFSRANRSPRMRDLYLEYYGLWAANSGDSLLQYNDIGLHKPWGMWGALESVTQDPHHGTQVPGAARLHRRKPDPVTSPRLSTSRGAAVLRA